MLVKHKFLYPVAVCLISLMVMGMGKMHKRVLETDGVKDLKVVHSVKAGKEIISIKGLVFSSSLGIETVKSEIQNEKLIVKVYLGVTRKGVDGNLDYSMVLPPSANKVLFGNQLKEIWSRE